MTVVLDLPGSPAGPCGPGAPCGPGTGVVAGGADCGTGTGVTVVFSHALRPSKPAIIANRMEYFISSLLRVVVQKSRLPRDFDFLKIRSRRKATNTYSLAGKGLQTCHSHDGLPSSYLRARNYGFFTKPK
jgi:hypothetical protein